jgi:CHAD domain-containing protein
MNAIPARGPSSHRERFETFVDEVLLQHARACRQPDGKAIHDLRVAIRRCLSVSAPMLRLDAGADWEGLHRSGRRLFRRLARLRDLQVQEVWLDHFDPRGDSLGALLRKELGREEKAARERAEAAILRFKRKRWARWREELPPHLDRLEAEPGYLLRLAVAQLGRAQAHHQLPLGGDRRYHLLRIELKHLRYFLEAFLPEFHETLLAELKAVQDLLGEAHDLDVLQDRLAVLAGGEASPRWERWQGHIAAARQQRFDAYAALSAAEGELLWRRWRRSLLVGLGGENGSPRDPLAKPADPQA